MSVPLVDVSLSSLSLLSMSILSQMKDAMGGGPERGADGSTRSRRRGRLRPYSSWENPTDSSLVPSGYQILGVIIPPVATCPIFVKGGKGEGNDSHAIRGGSGYSAQLPPVANFGET